jgi:radical SAM protein with 4Fe4S-binding SPASM domain
MNLHLAHLRHPGNLIALAPSYLVSRLTNRPTVWGNPLVVMIEPTNRCNLRCPLCHVGSGKLKRSPRNLSLDEFKTILDKLPKTVRILQLWNQGEPFMNPAFLDMIRIASVRGFHTITSTNAHFLTKNNTAQTLVNSGLSELVVSLDGYDDDSYQSVREMGCLSTVLQGMNAVKEAKKEIGAALPGITAQCLLLKKVESRLVEVHQVATKSGADRVVWKTAQVSSLEEARQVLPTDQNLWRYRIKNNQLVTKQRWNGCLRTWFSTVVLCDGSVVPCCFDKDGEYIMGNLLHQSFQEIWHGRTYMNFRQKTLRHRAFPICHNCTEGLSNLYVKMR